MDKDNFSLENDNDLNEKSKITVMIGGRSVVFFSGEPAEKFEEIEKNIGDLFAKSESSNGENPRDEDLELKRVILLLATQIYELNQDTENPKLKETLADGEDKIRSMISFVNSSV